MKLPHCRQALLALAVQLLLTTAAPLAFAQSGDAPRRGEPITLNFSNAEIEAVARTMAVITGRDVVVDPRVKGKMNLTTERPISPGLAFDQFSAALRMQGFAIVQADGLYKVVPEAEAKLQTGAVSTSLSGATGNQIVTQVFRLHHESANNLLPVLRPLIGPNNTINVNPGNNSLVITDYADNLQRLSRIIASMDVANASDVEVVQLEHAVATDIVPMLQRLLEGGQTVSASGTATAGAAPGAAQTDNAYRTSVLADPRTNSILLRAANPARLSQAKMLIGKLDSPSRGANASGNIHVVYLRNADATALATTLRAALAGQDGNSASPSTNLSSSGSSGGLSTNTRSGLTSLGGSTSGLDSLKWMEPRAVADVIRYEHPQIQAIVVAYLDPDQAGEVLSHFDHKVRLDIVLRVSSLNTVQPAALKELNLILEKQFSGSANTTRASLGGVKRAADIMNFLDSSIEGQLMDSIREVDEDLSTQIEDLMFVFDNLLDVEDRAIQLILKEIDNDTLMVALKGAQEELRAKFLRNMSSRAAEMLREDLEAQGPIRMSKVETEQKKILQIARRLAESGQIVLGNQGDDTYV